MFLAKNLSFLLGIFQNGRGIQPDKGRIQDTHGIELFDLFLHNFLKDIVIQLSQKAVIGPVRRKFLCDVEATVVGDETIAFQIIRQIGDIAETFAFHDHEGTDHGGHRITGATQLLLLLFQSRQIKVKKQRIIECSLGLRSKQANALYHFLSVDSGQPPLDDFSCNLIIPNWLAAF